uniref:Uncharacterized protein n=1 Tax=Megaselia scalaris TaxID=36166 RepID=T1GP49_MEGSC
MSLGAMNSENCKEKSTSSPPTPAQLFDSSMLLCQTNLLCDHHSSEEELEVINGPCSGNEVNDGQQNLHSLPSEDELFGDDDGSGDNHHNHHHQDQEGKVLSSSMSPSRPRSNMLEIRKRSLAHSLTKNSSSAGAGFAGGSGGSATLDLEVRSVSPPAKLFHCAISPKRRPMRTHHAPQRLQRPHRPCLDFDKMQQSYFKLLNNFIY